MKKLRYAYTRISKSNEYYSMSYKGTALTHRLVMATHLGRCLRKGEEVHHIDGDILNNSISNLKLVSPKQHFTLTRVRYLEHRIPGMEIMIQRLKAELLYLKRNYID